MLEYWKFGKSELEKIESLEYRDGKILEFR
jgi:hypothetical protein